MVADKCEKKISYVEVNNAKLNAKKIPRTQYEQQSKSTFKMTAVLDKIVINVC